MLDKIKSFAVLIPHHNTWTGEKTEQRHFLPIPSDDIIILAKQNKDKAIDTYREKYKVGLLQSIYAIDQAIEP